MLTRLVMLGPPGAGKGTQAARLAKILSVPHISTGDIFRAAISEGTPLGIEAKKRMDRGEYVSDEITIGIVRDRLLKPDCEKGFILDGFPRSINQAESLKEMLKEQNRTLDAAIYVNVPNEALVNRLLFRRTCEGCKKMYHLEFNPSKNGDNCEVCGGKLIIRSDDSREVIENRLVVYERETAPVVDYYRKENLLLEVDGARPMEEVENRISDLVGSVSVR